MLGSSARGHRRVLLHLAHTIGANAVFTRLALAARDVTGHGGDDTLLEWRSAAACARGRCRPDGYGCYRRGEARFGFFLEYDRGTERAREYATKLEAYYRYRDSGSAARDYPSGLLRSLRDGPPANTSVITASSWSAKGAR